MAITEATKRLVLNQRNQLWHKYEKNLNQIEEYQEAITRLEAINLKLKADFDSLKKDIAEPTPIDI